MNVLITEQQNKLILLEGMSDIMSAIFEHGADFSANLYKRIMKRYKFNLKILLTFGASVGALMEPLMEFLKGNYPDLNEEQITLLVVATVCVVFNEGKEVLKQVLPIIKKQNLENEFTSGVNKVKALITSFKGFIATLGNSAAFISDVMSYIYLIPVLGYLATFVSQNSLTPEQIENLVKLLVASSSLHVTTAFLEESIKRMLNNLRK
jgi:UDP-N-acetylglucosamine:LPS N-acetylglucosamine transferase